MKVYSITTGKTKIEFSVWQVAAGYEARINGMVIYRSKSYSICSEAISDFSEDSAINVFNTSSELH